MTGLARERLGAASVVVLNTRSLSHAEGSGIGHFADNSWSIPMKRIPKLAALFLGGTLMAQLAVAAPAGAPNAATDPRIDPMVRSFLAEINKDSSSFWELPQPKPQETLTGLQSQTPVDMSGVTTTGGQ